MRRRTKSVLGMAFLLGIGLHASPGVTQMRGPRINNVRDVTCVANWERHFRLISPGFWEMRMGENDRNPFIFRETDRNTTTIFLQSVQNSRLKSKLNLKKQRIKYIIPGQENDPLYFAIQSFNINGGSC
jgi:hypothetical protein